MIVEYAQMLCTAARQRGAENVPYRNTHPNHPSTLWVTESKSNYLWLCALFAAMAAEYFYRYGKYNLAYRKLAPWFATRPLKDVDFPDLGLTKLPLCMPEMYHHEDPVEAYRRFYVYDKATFAVWKYRPPPEWWPHERRVSKNDPLVLEDPIAPPESVRYHFSAATPEQELAAARKLLTCG